MNKTLKLKINNKPYPIPIEMRPLWRITLIVIIVKIMTKKNKKIDLQKLNIMLWMLIRSHDWNSFKLFLDGKIQSAPFISSDQANYIAIELSFKKELIQFNKEKIETTSLSENLFNTLIENNLFKDEIIFVENYLSKITVDKIDKMLGKK